MYWSKTNENTKSPRLSARRVKSARELYRPAITDLSEQAGWNITELKNELISYNITQFATEPPHTPDTDNSNSNINVNGKHLENTDKSTFFSPFCLSSKLPKVFEEQCRRRVIKSARQRYRITDIKKTKSVESSATVSQRPCSSISYASNINNTGNDRDVIDLLITNSLTGEKQQDKLVYKRKTISKVRRNGKNTSTIGGTLLSDGFKGQLSGFHQHLVTTHPKKKQKISMWLTKGFKIQSFRSKNNRASTTRNSNGYNDKSKTRCKISDKKLIEDLMKIRLDENEDVVVYDNFEHKKRLFSARSVDSGSFSSGLMVNGIRRYKNGL